MHMLALVLGKPVLGLAHKGTFISKPGKAAAGIGLESWDNAVHRDGN
jgi:hypothetical protein